MNSARVAVAHSSMRAGGSTPPLLARARVLVTCRLAGAVVPTRVTVTACSVRTVLFAAPPVLTFACVASTLRGARPMAPARIAVTACSVRTVLFAAPPVLTFACVGTTLCSAIPMTSTWIVVTSSLMGTVLTARITRVAAATMGVTVGCAQTVGRARRMVAACRMVAVSVYPTSCAVAVVRLPLWHTGAVFAADVWRILASRLLGARLAAVARFALTRVRSATVDICTRATILTRARFTLIHVNLAIVPSPSIVTQAQVAILNHGMVDQVGAVTRVDARNRVVCAVFARVAGALVDIDLTVGALPPRNARARVLCNRHVPVAP